jgi:hypothetical protein
MRRSDNLIQPCYLRHFRRYWWQLLVRGAATIALIYAALLALSLLAGR